MKTSLGLGKYRDLLLAILLFIVLDLGILFFNFFASIQLERDASRINTAGELLLTRPVREWKKAARPALARRPALFLLLA